MSLNRKLAHNTLWQFGGRIVGTLLAVVALSQLFRYLGPTEYGRFHIIVTIVQMAGIIADMGLYLIVLNDISRPDSNHHQIISQNFVFRFYLNILYLIATALLVLVLPYESAIKLGIFLMSFSNIFIWFSQLINTFFQKRLRTHYVAIAEVIGRAALLIATVLMIHWQASLVLLTLTVVIGNLANFLVSWYFSRGHIKLRWEIDWSYIRNVLRRTWPVAVSIWFSLLYFKADTIILSFFKSDYVVGIYGMPYRILETLITLPLVFMGLMMPLLSTVWNAGNQVKFRGYMQKAFDGLSLMGIPLLAGTIPLAKPIVLLFAGEQFVESVPILQILMIGVLIMYIGALFGHAVITVGEQKKMIKYYVMIAALMLAGYLLLIPPYSYWAAAWLTNIGELLVLIATFLVIYKKTGFMPRSGVFVKSSISAIIMSGILYLVRDWTLFLTLPLGVAVYFGMMCLTGGLKREFIKEVLRFKE